MTSVPLLGKKLVTDLVVGLFPAGVSADQAGRWRLVTIQSGRQSAISGMQQRDAAQCAKLLFCIPA